MIKILIVDDSALARRILTRLIGSEAGLQVVGSAGDAASAHEMIDSLRPDVVTLDVEMPDQNGLTLLADIMRRHPVPVVMVSSQTAQGADVTLRALELGAIDFVTKPMPGAPGGLDGYARELIRTILAAARSRRSEKPPAPQRARAESPKPILPAALPATPSASPRRGERLILIGASTGGTEAIKTFLVGLGADYPPILIVQHMPPGFTEPFARRLDSICRMKVREGLDGETLQGGHAYLAPGGRHMELRGGSQGLRIAMTDEAPVNGHRPSVDRLFHSARPFAGAGSLAVLLTGMGSDGAQGLHALHRVGVYTLAQSEASCVVYGMPRAAVHMGAVDTVLDVSAMSAHVTDWLQRGGQA